MTRTLADMTPAERQQMIGRWCEGAAGNLVVYVRDSRPVEGENEWGDSAVVIGGGYDPANDLSRPWLGSLIPRPDLPRAWTPSGEPVPGEWVESPSSEHQAEMDEQWRLLRDHNAEAWHVLDEVQHAKAMGRKTIRIDDLLGDTDE